MKCPVCNLTTSVASGTVVDGYMEQTIVCTNPKCALYAGKDLGSATAVVEIKKTKI